MRHELETLQTEVQLERFKRALPRPCLMLVTERMECSRLGEIVCAAVAGGVDVVQVRDRRTSWQELAELSALISGLVPAAVALVNSSVDAARHSDVAGLHLPEAGARIQAARSEIGPEKLVGRSVHSAAAAVRAWQEGADYLVAGTIFASRSHPDTVPAGPALLRTICAVVTVPVIAIGGVTPENTAQCLEAGASGIAVLSNILHSADPRSMAARYREVLDKFSGRL